MPRKSNEPTESKDPYAEGKHIPNPEPNNGKGKNPKKFDAQADEKDVKKTKTDQKQLDTDVQDQKHVDANTDPATK